MQTSSPTMRLMDCCNHYRATHFFMLNDISLIWWYIYRAYTRPPFRAGERGVSLVHTLSVLKVRDNKVGN